MDLKSEIEEISLKILNLNLDLELTKKFLDLFFFFISIKFLLKLLKSWLVFIFVFHLFDGVVGEYLLKKIY